MIGDVFPNSFLSVFLPLSIPSLEYSFLGLILCVTRQASILSLAGTPSLEYSFPKVFHPYSIPSLEHSLPYSIPSLDYSILRAFLL